MFSKKKRVTKKLFDEILKEGRTFSTLLFNFRFIYSKDKPKYTFVVPKKIINKSTNRNKLKRKGLNIIKELSLGGGQGIFFFKEKGTQSSLSEIKKDIIFILKKTKIIE